MADPTGSLSTEVETSSIPADTSSVDTSHSESQTTDTSPEDTSVEEAPKRKLEDIINEKYDELRTKKEEQASKTASDNATGQRKVESPPPAKEQAKTEQPATQAPAKEIDPITGRELEPVKVPESTPGLLRDEWAKIPRKWQEYISKRELDMRRTVQQYGTDVKFAKEIQTYAKDMEPFLKQGNIKLTDYAKDLFQMAHRMSAGDGRQRAQVVADIINTFRPDPATLKALLGGQRQNIPPVQKPVDIDAEVQKRLDAQKKAEADKELTDLTEAFYNDPKNQGARELDAKIGKIIESGLVDFEDGYGNMRSHNDILSDAFQLALKATGKQPTQPVPAAATPPAPQQNPNAGKEPVRQAAPSPGAGRPVKQPQKRYGKRVEDAVLDAWDIAAGRKG